jgi:hypothetical protein
MSSKIIQTQTSLKKGRTGLINDKNTLFKFKTKKPLTA